jgi:hypothetical protein
VTVTLPPAREVARHEAYHAAALCLQGMVPKQVRIDWPREDQAGFVTIDWGDGPDRDTAKRVLIAVLLGGMTEGFDGWDNWPIDPDRMPVGRDVTLGRCATSPSTSGSVTTPRGFSTSGKPTSWAAARSSSGSWSRSPASSSASRC